MNGMLVYDRLCAVTTDLAALLTEQALPGELRTPLEALWGRLQVLVDALPEALREACEEALRTREGDAGRQG